MRLDGEAMDRRRYNIPNTVYAVNGDGAVVRAGGFIIGSTVPVVVYVC